MIFYSKIFCFIGASANIGHTTLDMKYVYGCSIEHDSFILYRLLKKKTAAHKSTNKNDFDGLRSDWF